MGKWVYTIIMSNKKKPLKSAAARLHKWKLKNDH